MKKFWTLILLFFIFATGLDAKAQTADDIYNNAYKNSELSSLSEIISKETAEIIAELGIDLSNYDTFLNLDADSFLDVIINFIKSGLTEPLTAFSTALCIILIFSTIGGMWSSPLEMSTTYSYISLLSLSTIVLIPLITAVNNTITVIKSICAFMLAFIPIYGGLLISTGNISSGLLYQSVMLGICEFITQVVGFFIAPIISIYMCIGMSSAVSGVEGAHKLALAVKSVANWVLGFIMTLFTGFLSIQSVVGKSADNLTLKTTRFFVGSAVPVVGGYLSEALTTVTAGIGILRSSAMAWCVLVLAIMVVPTIIQLYLWRISLSLLSGISSMFSISEASRLFEICTVALGFLVAVVLSISVMFILSLVIIKVGT